MTKNSIPVLQRSTSKGQLGGELIEHDGGLKDSAALGRDIPELVVGRLPRDPTDEEHGLDPSPSL